MSVNNTLVASEAEYQKADQVIRLLAPLWFDELPLGEEVKAFAAKQKSLLPILALEEFTSAQKQAAVERISALILSRRIMGKLLTGARFHLCNQRLTSKVTSVDWKLGERLTIKRTEKHSGAKHKVNPSWYLTMSFAPKLVSYLGMSTVRIPNFFSPYLGH